MSKNEAAENQEALQAEAEVMWKRVYEFRREMNLKETRLWKKCQEDKEDVFGQLAGLVWIHRMRSDKAATFDAVLVDFTQEGIVEELKKILPAV